MISKEINIDKINRNKIEIVRAVDDIINRKLIEKSNIKVIVDIESGKRQDNLRTINSGFNTIIGKIATKRNICVCFDLEELRNLDRENKAQRLTKIREILKLARKTKTKIGIINYKQEKDARALLQTLGASSQQSSKAVTF